MTQARHPISRPLKKTDGSKIQVRVYVTPNMHAILLCKRGSLCANILAIPTHMHMGIPICVRQSPYA